MPKVSCQELNRQSCSEVPKKDCQQKARRVCNLVPKISTKEVSERKCSTHQKNVCQPVTKEVNPIYFGQKLSGALNAVFDLINFTY